jgi:glycerol-3-phosphate dehydrogenase subunit B
MPSADVVVVGAGLAGMTAAIGLADAGVSVEVVARGHAASHWTAGGLDVAAPPGAATPAEGLARLRKVREHPYAMLHRHVATAIARVAQLVAESGLRYEGDLETPIRRVPTAIGRTRPVAIVPAAQAAALAPWSPDERLVVCGIAGFKDFWADHVAASLTRPWVWGEGADDDPGRRPGRVESVTVSLPGLEGRRNLSALVIARQFDDPAWRTDAIDVIAAALGRPGGQAGRVALPAVVALGDHPAAFREIREALDLVPFEIPLVPPSIPGLRLFAALRAALLRRGGRITLGEPVVDVAVDGRRVVSVAMSAATRRRTIRTGAVVLATGGIAGGGLLGTADGRLLETVLGLPTEAPPADGWLARQEFDAGGHPLERAGIRTDERLRPVDAKGRVVLENVAIVGSLLAGQRYLAERCGDGVAVASGLRAAEVQGKTIDKGRRTPASSPARDVVGAGSAP